MGDQTLQAVGRIGNGSIYCLRKRIIKAVCSMQDKMLSYSGSRNLNGLLDAHFTSRSNELFGKYLWCFLAEAAASCFYTRHKFFFFQITFDIFCLLGQLSLLALL